MSDGSKDLPVEFTSSQGHLLLVWVDSICGRFFWFAFILSHSWWWTDTCLCLVSMHSQARPNKLDLCFPKRAQTYTPHSTDKTPTHSHAYSQCSGVKFVYLFLILPVQNPSVMTGGWVVTDAAYVTEMKWLAQGHADSDKFSAWTPNPAVSPPHSFWMQH